MQSFFDDVKDFSSKFKLQCMHQPGFCNSELMETRFKHLEEELKEISAAYSDKNLLDFFDGLIDLVYVALGTAANCGLPFNDGWERVHEANMLKERAKEVTKRGSTQDVVKPIGWLHPNLEELITPPKGIVIVEGPDHCGKTTLCNYLIRKHNAMYLHATYPIPNGDVFAYHLNLLMKAIRVSQNRLVLIDRLWPSEVVYGNIYRKGVSMPGYQVLIDRLVRKHAGIYIFCLFSRSNNSNKKYVEILRKANKMNAQRDLYVEHGKQVYKSYVNLFNVMWSPRRTDLFRYDYMEDGEDLEEVSDHIMSFLKTNINLQPMIFQSTDVNNFLGHAQYADILFVGDRYSPKAKNKNHVWPFFELSNCSGYFLEKLQRTNVPDYKFAFTNLNEKLGDKIVLYCRAKGKTIIALGEPVVNGLIKLGVSTFHKMKHPQWYRRFNYGGSMMSNDLNNILKKEKVI